MSRDDEAFDAAPPGGDAEAEPTGLGPLRDARTLRPGSSVAVGIVGLVCGLALLVPAILVPPPSWTLISSIALAFVLLWLFVVRPSAVIHAEGVRLINPMRVVDVTWPAIDEVRSRWALELFSGGRKFTAWAVPSDPGRPRYGRQALAIGANRLRGPAAPEVDPRPKRPKIEAQTVAAEIEALREEDRRRKDGRTPRIAVQSWDPVSVGLLVAGIAFFVIGTFVV
ncbi:PH domain-containing protein [Intrasporangium sp. YIM S08009]|uniref:PH domain-containing protein n=1 Tax=Intrasporangium zincisolvens TaxID=3080018 RepID=UPI002B0615D2|nr:PH domain-containing protein [Intrasporangium sp. YIM S08009]